MATLFALPLAAALALGCFAGLNRLARAIAGVDGADHREGSTA